jgi:uncharacterized protein YxjI
MSTALARIQPLLAASQLYVRQKKEWAEILVDWEGANQYEVLDQTQRTVALIAERSEGFLDTIKRVILRSHRPLSVEVFDGEGERVAHLSRSFFWFFSDLFVDSPEGRRLGSVHRRFGIIRKKYDLLDARGGAFARISAPLWRIWTFPIISAEGETVGQISKKWSGLMREAFSDADTFLIDYGQGEFNDEQRLVILAAAISVDFDFFEDNDGAGSVLDTFSFGD